MKNKKLMYALLPIVLIVWGLIFYKIFSAIQKPSRQSFVPVVETIRTEYIAQDTFRLIAHYRDPFLGNPFLIKERETIITDVIKTSPPPVVKEEEPKIPVQWPSIQYGGMIKNQRSNRQIVLVQINGQDNLMKTGDIVAGIELSAVYKDSIEVLFENEKKVIKKTKNAG